jgi:hypothetical protein
LELVDWFESFMERSNSVCFKLKALEFEETDTLCTKPVMCETTGFISVMQT